MARTKVPKGMAKFFSAIHRGLYKRLGGRFVGGIGDAPVHLLTTTGRRSGKTRTVPLIMLEEGGGFVAIASYSGHDTHPAWYLNLQADPHATVTSGRNETAVVPRDTEGEQRQQLRDKMVAVYEDYDAYAEVTDREIPVVLLEPAG